MRIYREVLIESAEQAEALPSGTLARHSQGAGMDHAHKLPAYPRTTTGFWRSTDGLVSDGAMVGWTALVPISMEDLIRDTVAETLAEQARQAAEADRKRREFDDEVRRRADERHMGDAFERVNRFIRHGEA